MLKAAVLILTLCLLQDSAGASVVQTLNERLEGKLEMHEVGVTVSGRDVPWKDVLYIISSSALATLPSPHAIRMVSGEKWGCTITSFKEGRIQFDTQLLGSHTIPASAVAALDFAANLPAPQGRPLTLYRRTGEPIPGRMTMFDGRQIRLNTQLGSLAFDAAQAERYMMRAPLNRPPEADEVALADGSILSGQTRAAKDGIILNHAVFGELRLRGDLIRSIRRHSDVVIYLAPSKPDAVNSIPLLVLPTPPVRTGLDKSGRFIDGIILRPQSEITYKLPLQTRKARLFAVVLPIDGAAGVTRVRIRNGNAVLLDKEIAPDAQPESVSLDLAPTGEITIEADFAAGYHFPLGLIIGDPMVIPE